MNDPQHISHVNNPDLISHQQAETTFLDSLNNYKISGSWLISGIKGIGKATLAYRLARFIMSQPDGEKSITNNLFGEDETANTLHIPPDDPIFSRIIHGTHADVITIEPTYLDEKGKETASCEMRIYQLRNLLHKLSQTHSESKWRVVIIDSVDDMNRNSANALLKILEEPPHNTIILLISHCPGKLLPTITSRCRKIKLQPLSEGDVISIIQKQIPNISQDDAHFAAVLSDGSPGMAVEIHNNGGRALYDEFLTILSATPNIDFNDLQKFADKLALKNNVDKWHSTIYMLQWFIAKTIILGAIAEDFPSFNEHDTTTRNSLLSHYSTAQLSDMWNRTNELSSASGGLNMSKKLTTEQIFGLFT